MSKAMANWQRLPNSRMDRQHRPKAFFRQKERVDEASFRLHPEGSYNQEQEKKDAEKLLALMEKLEDLELKRDGCIYRLRNGKIIKYELMEESDV